MPTTHSAAGFQAGPRVTAESTDDLNETSHQRRRFQKISDGTPSAGWLCEYAHIDGDCRQRNADGRSATMSGTVRGLRQTRPTSELAYMVREDWGQRGTAMRQQSAVIRDWLGHPPYVVATADRKKYESDNSADREFVTYVAHAATDRNVIDLSNLNGLRRGDKTLTRPLIVLHPYEEHDCDLLREIVALESVARLFVIVWSPRDLVRTWLDGVGAVNLHTRSALGAPDVVQLEAAKCWVDEQYNGLSSGNGKDAVVQLLRLFSAAGYPLDADTWLRAFFAAGGRFDEATKVAKLIKEMQGLVLNCVTLWNTVYLDRALAGLRRATRCSTKTSPACRRTCANTSTSTATTRSGCPTSAAPGTRFATRPRRSRRGRFLAPSSGQGLPKLGEPQGRRS